MTVWLNAKAVEAIHVLQIKAHGGAHGIRDPGLLESALARPLNLAGYGEPDTVELGGCYAVAIARNHPFLDGNKRAAWMALVLFLALNGLELEATDAGAVVAMLALASGELTDEEFTLWVREHVRPRE